MAAREHDRCFQKGCMGTDVLCLICREDVCRLCIHEHLEEHAAAPKKPDDEDGLE